MIFMILTGFILAEASRRRAHFQRLIGGFAWSGGCSSWWFFSPPSPTQAISWRRREPIDAFAAAFVKHHSIVLLFVSKMSTPASPRGSPPHSQGARQAKEEGGEHWTEAEAQMTGCRGSTSDASSRVGIFCRGAEVCAGFKPFGRETRTFEKREQAVWPVFESGGWPWRSSREAWEISPAWETATMAASTRAMRPRSCCTSCQCGTPRPRCVEWTLSLTPSAALLHI
jgi:hypothetical protein